MEWIFEPDDDEAFGEARDGLLDRFMESVDAERTVNSASLLLDWKFNYGDGDLMTWTTAHISEILLEWAPRKVSMPASSARPMVTSFQAFFAFLAKENLLGLGSSSWKAIDAHLDKLVKPFEEAMGDRSKFGMAKSLFAGVGNDFAAGIPDEKSMQAMMDSFNSLSFEQRSRTLGLPVRPPNPWLELTEGVGMLPAIPVDRDVVTSFIDSAPFFIGIETIRRFVGTGRKLTAKGNLTLADTKAVAGLLGFTGFGPGETPRFELRSADDIPLLQFMLRFARLAGATKLANSTLGATAAWAKKDPIERIAKAVIELLERGPIQMSLSDKAWTNHAVDEMIDGGVAHILALLWAVGEFPVEPLVESALDIGLTSLRWGPGATAAMQKIVVKSTFDRLLGVLTDLGVVARYRDDRDDPDDPDLMGDEGADMVALTEFGRAILKPYLKRRGYDVPVAGDLVGKPLRDLFQHVGEWRVDRLSIEFGLWAESLSESEIIDQLAGVADSSDPGWRLCASELARRLPPDVSEQALRRMLDTKSRGQAIGALIEFGAADVPDDSDALMLAGVDLFSQMLHPDDVDELIALISGIDEIEHFIDEVWRVREPHAGDLLAVIGRSHPDKRIAKLARTAVVRHRSHLANIPLA